MKTTHDDVRCIAWGIYKNEKILYLSFRTNRENISNHALCLMKFKGLKEKHYFNEIAPKDTKMRIEVIFKERFVGLRLLDLKNETFSQHHCHNKLCTIFDLECFYEKLKNGSIAFLKALTTYA